MGNYTVEGPGEMCYAVFWVRGPACDTKRPLRGNDQTETSPAGEWVRPARGTPGRRIAGGASGRPHAAAAKTVIEFREITDPFIACAASTALPVAMRAASRPA